MFSVQEKRDIAEKVQKILRDTHHVELPDGEINFLLHVEGAEPWSWADIRNNKAVTTPRVNSWNERPNSRRSISLARFPQTIIIGARSAPKANPEQRSWEAGRNAAAKACKDLRENRPTTKHGLLIAEECEIAIRALKYRARSAPKPAQRHPLHRRRK
jgi:hypothetical protein